MAFENIDKDIKAGALYSDELKALLKKRNTITLKTTKYKKEAPNKRNSPINEFISSMAKARGYARANQYEVVLNLPPMLHNLQANYGRQLTLHCDSVSMPGHDLQTQSRQYGSEPAIDMVTSHGYQGMIQASFYLDSRLNERHIFETWQEMAVSSGNTATIGQRSTHKANYYDDYASGSMEIYQFASSDFKNNLALSGQNSKGSQTGTKIDAQDYGVNLDGFPVKGLHMNIKGEAKYAIKATEVYPATISDIEYAYASDNTILKVNVGFNFKQWRNISHTLKGFQPFDI